jgi:hypothetical protein
VVDVNARRVHVPIVGGFYPAQSAPADLNFAEGTGKVAPLESRH